MEFHHVPIHKLRINKSKNKFFYSDDWCLRSKSIVYDRYAIDNNTDGTSKIFYFDGYFPSTNNVYSTPEYYASTKSIATEIAIREFRLNNITNNFSPSSIITFYNGGNVDDETKEEIADDIERKFKGTSGNKFMIDFQNASDGKGVDVKQLSSNDWADAFTVFEESNIKSIVRGHQLPSGSLFGLETAGKLGSSQEYEFAFEVFKAHYIVDKRDQIEAALNRLFKNFDGIAGKVKFADKQLFQTQISDELKARILTFNEIRKSAGFEVIERFGDKLLSEIEVSTAPVTIATSPVEQAEEVKKKSYKKLTEEDYELIKDLGVHADEFEIIVQEFVEQKFDKESDIAQYVIDNDIRGLKLPELVDVLSNEGGISTTQEEVQKVLKHLTDSGITKVDIDSDNRIKITPSSMPKLPDTGEISVMYKYVERPDVPKAKAGSRSFCQKLIDNNRLYTREDIQTMSRIFGYQIWDYQGGFYHNPDTHVTTPYCRHIWQSVRVKKKTS